MKKILINVAGVFTLGMASLFAEGEKRVDPFAGKTITNGQMGNAIIRARYHNAPKVGEEAPDFTLEKADAEGQVTLSSFKGKKPVVLVFGSVT